jgi:hypothetical protein
MIIYTCHVVCDGCGARPANTGPTAYSIRAKLRRFGWRRSGGYDLCPNCKGWKQIMDRKAALAELMS